MPEEGCNLYFDKDDLEKIDKSLAQGRGSQIDPELARQYKKDDEEQTARYLREKESWAKVNPKLKGLLPRGKAEREAKTGVPETAPKSERWDDFGIFSKNEMQKFRNQSPLYRRISPVIRFNFFGGLYDGKSEAHRVAQNKKWDYYPYLPTFDTLTTYDRYKGYSLLQIKEECAEQLLIIDAHERAEIYWADFMSKEQRGKWFVIYNQNTVVRGKPPISDNLRLYRRDRWKEDFCECVGYFEVRPQQIKESDEDKYNFIKALYSSLEADGY